ncbi:hypothetical protein FOA52_013937 [Chlamydomonas sp. UWO 241]|nr:hypothetical protein FOA52_013937 [Chlamydomonas sp. UWO 241]
MPCACCCSTAATPQLEGLIRGVLERRRLVRRATLTLHQAFVQRELALEVTASTLLLGCLTAASLVGVAPSWRLATFMNIVAFTVTHLLCHSVLLSLAYSAAARHGTVRSLGLGLVAILGYYLAVVPLIQALTGIDTMPARLNLEPWGRPDDAALPLYHAAALIWPLFGVGVPWQAIHTVSNTVARHSFSVAKARNHIKF